MPAPSQCVKLAREEGLLWYAERFCLDNAAAYPLFLDMVKVNPNTLLPRHNIAMDARVQPQLKQPNTDTACSSSQANDRYLPAKPLPSLEELGNLLPYMDRLRNDFPDLVKQHSVAATPSTMFSVLAAGAAMVYRAVSGTSGSVVSTEGGTSSSADSQVVSWGVVARSEDDDATDSADDDESPVDDEEQEQQLRQREREEEVDLDEGGDDNGVNVQADFESNEHGDSANPDSDSFLIYKDDKIPQPKADYKSPAERRAGKQALLVNISKARGEQ